MGRPLRIALAQLNSTPEVHTNIKNLQEAVEKAAQDGCQLIVFPEYYTQGIVADAPHKVINDTGVQESMCELAKKAQIDIVIGTLVERLSEAKQHEVNAREHRPYNTYVTDFDPALCKMLIRSALLHRAYYISKRGEILGKYRKRNLCEDTKDSLCALPRSD